MTFFSRTGESNRFNLYVQRHQTIRTPTTYLKPRRAVKTIVNFTFMRERLSTRTFHPQIARSRFHILLTLFPVTRLTTRHARVKLPDSPKRRDASRCGTAFHPLETLPDSHLFCLLHIFRRQFLQRCESLLDQSLFTHYLIPFCLHRIPALSCPTMLMSTNWVPAGGPSATYSSGRDKKTAMIPM